MMHFLTEAQNTALKRLARRVHGEAYKLRMTYLPQHGDKLPGYVSICARSQQLYTKMQKLLRMVVPDIKLSFETGKGWHTGDHTQYYFGSFDYIVL